MIMRDVEKFDFFLIITILVIVFIMNDNNDSGYSSVETDDEVTQLAQKCMRCRKYMLGDEEVIADPKFKNCQSHAICIEESKKRKLVRKELKKKNS